MECSSSSNTSGVGDNDWQQGLETVQQRDLHLLTHKQFTDCTYNVGYEGRTKKFECHRLYLAKTSSKFAAQLYGAMRVEGEIRIMDIEPEVFELFLQYVYQGSITLEDYDLACGLLCLASMYMLHASLVQQCMEFITSKLDLENVWYALEFSRKCHLQDLEDNALQIIRSKTGEALNDPWFLKIEEATLVNVLEQEPLNVSSELELFEASVIWARNDVTRRGLDCEDQEELRRSLRPFLQHLRLLTLTNDQLIEFPDVYEALTAEQLVMVFQTKSREDANVTEGFCNSRSPRKILPPRRQIAELDEGGLSFKVTGIPHAEIESITDWSSFEFSNYASFQMRSQVFNITGVACLNQIKPPDCESATYEEDVTLVVYDRVSNTLLAQQRFTQTMNYTVRQETWFYVRLTQRYLQSNLQNNIQLAIVFHKSGQYPYSYAIPSQPSLDSRRFFYATNQ